MENPEMGALQRTGEPRGLGDILGESFQLYRDNAVLLILTAAVAMGPVYLVKDAILGVALAPVAAGSLERESTRMEELQQEITAAQARGASQEELGRLAQEQMAAAVSAVGKGGSLFAGALLSLFALLVTIPFLILAAFLAQAALTVVVADPARSGLRWPDPWRVVLRELPALFGTALVVFLGVAVGLCFFVLPGLIFGFFAALTVPVLLLEKKRGVAAIQRSIELVRADVLRVALVLIVFAIVKVVASWLGGLLVPSRFFFLHNLLGDLVSIAVLPIPIIGTVLLYQDLAGRVRPGARKPQGRLPHLAPQGV